MRPARGALAGARAGPGAVSRPPGPPEMRSPPIVRDNLPVFRALEALIPGRTARPPAPNPEQDRRQSRHQGYPWQRRIPPGPDGLGGCGKGMGEERITRQRQRALC